MSKKRLIKSKPGLFGVTYHYEDGKYIGKSRPALFGNRKIHYDAYGKQIGTSRHGILADEVHFDTAGKRYISSYPGLSGEMHMSSGRPVGKSVPSIIEGSYTSINNDSLATGDNIGIEYHDFKGSLSDYDDGYELNDIETDIGCSKVQRNVPRLVKRIIGILFALVTILLLVMTISYAVKKENVAPGVAACIISSVAAFFCLRPKNKDLQDQD